MAIEHHALHAIIDGTTTDRELMAFYEVAEDSCLNRSPLADGRMSICIRFKGHWGIHGGLQYHKVLEMGLEP